MAKMPSPAPAEAPDARGVEVFGRGSVAPPPALPASDEPPLESLVQLRYRHHRRQRNARVLRRQESRLAKYRFWIVLAVLVSLAAVFVVASLHEVRHLFGI